LSITDHQDSGKQPLLDALVFSHPMAVTSQKGGMIGWCPRTPVSSRFYWRAAPPRGD
jgi:hypothetical protein